MPQLHLYVPNEVAAAVRQRADALGVSVSKYLASLVERELRPGWPPTYFDDVVGRWHGPPLERPPQLPLEDREAL